MDAEAGKRGTRHAGVSVSDLSCTGRQQKADDSDFIPYHWHPELEIITVDAGHVSLTIADHVYEGEHDVFSLREKNCTKSARRDGKISFDLLCLQRILQFARADQSGIRAACTACRRSSAVCKPACVQGRDGQREVRALLAQIVRACLARAPGASLRSRRRCSASWRYARRYGC